MSNEPRTPNWDYISGIAIGIAVATLVDWLLR